MDSLRNWRQRLRRIFVEDLEARCLDILSRANPNEPPGSPGPNQVEAALDELDRINREHYGIEDE